MSEQNNNTISVLVEECLVEPIKKKFSYQSNEIGLLRNELSGLRQKLNQLSNQLDQLSCLSTLAQSGLQELQKTVLSISEQEKRNSRGCKTLAAWLVVVAFFVVAFAVAVVILFTK